MIATSEDNTELVLKEAIREDSGTYSLMLENKCGKKMVHIKVKVIGPPAPPEGPLRFDDIQAHSVKVSWKPPADDGGSEILGYIVERRKVPKAAWYTVDTRVVDTSVVVKGLKENIEYEFKVTAENQFGTSRYLKSDQSVTPKTPLCEFHFHVFQFVKICEFNIYHQLSPFNGIILPYNLFKLIGPPEPPSNPPEILDVTKSSVALAWGRPKYDGGSAITGYFIELREAGTEKWKRHETQITTTMYTLSGLTPDKEYHFRIVAKNEIGESDPGPSSDSIICKDPFGR